MTNLREVELKRLLLLRHAKSDWSAAGGDHERPLNERGRRSAAVMGAQLSTLDKQPELILCSSALRARETLKVALAAAELVCATEYLEQLYGADPESVVDLLQERADTADTVLLVGHEPTWSALAGSLVGSASIAFPTATLARIDFELNSWSSVNFGHGTLRWLVTPKLLGA